MSTVLPVILFNLDVDHFRSVGWINMAIGVAFLLLQVVMFQGEYKFSCTATINVKKWNLSHFTSAEGKCRERFCKIFVSQLSYSILHELNGRFVFISMWA